MKDLGNVQNKGPSNGLKDPTVMTRHIVNPPAWNLDECDWLTDNEKKALDGFPFDFGNILYQESCFMPYNMIAGALCTTEQELNEYCQILWHKDWYIVHLALAGAARNEAVNNIFGRWAKEGSSSAMQIMANGVMKMNQESENKTMTIKIINDIADEDNQRP